MCPLGSYKKSKKCKSCECSPKHSLGTCSKKGKCHCLPRYSGKKCTQCAQGYENYPTCKPIGQGMILNLFRKLEIKSRHFNDVGLWLLKLSLKSYKIWNVHVTHGHLTFFVQRNEVNACVKQQIFPAKIVTDVQKALRDFQHVLWQAEIWKIITNYNLWPLHNSLTS